MEFPPLRDITFVTFETLSLCMLAENSLTCKFRPAFVYIILLLVQIFRRIFFEGLGIVALLSAFIADTIVIGAFCTGKLGAKAFLIILFYSLSIIFDSLSFILIKYINETIIETLFDSNTIQILSAVLSKIMLLSAVLLIKGSLKIGNRLREWIRYLPTPVLTIVVLVWCSPFTNDMGNRDIVRLLIVSCVFILISNFYLIIFIQNKNEKERLKFLLKIQKEHKQLVKDHFWEVREAYSQIDRIAHDLNEHLNYLEQAADVENVRDYINRLRGRSYARLLNFTGNFDIDVILNAKKHELQKKGLTLTTRNILPPSIEWIDPVDFSIILGNSLTNAIEACVRCGGSEITAVFKYGEDWLIISIENPTGNQPVPKKKGLGFISTKEGGRHGIGMESMATSIERYDGTMKYKITNGMFRLDVLLQNTTQKRKN